MKYLFLLLIIVSCTSSGEKRSKTETGKIEPYQPKESVGFPHEIHAKNGVDCKYCHNPKTENNRTELTKNICLNCHKSVSGDQHSEEKAQFGRGSRERISAQGSDIELK